MKKLIMVLTLAMSIFAACGKKEAKEEKVINIGITQIVEHPSLDQIRQGIIDRLAEKGYKDGEKVNINFQNAQGEMSNAQLIANEFADKEDLIVAITTPSAQAALNAIKDKPIFFSAVTDPVAAGLKGANITGTSDRTPIEKQFELAMEVVKDIKTVGIVYNLGEANSQVQVDIVKGLSEKYGFELKTIGINTVNEISQGLDAIIDDVDIIYTPVDNLLASGYPVIVQKATDRKVPVLGAVTDFVEKGAFGTEGINQYKIGVQTADMIVRYLEEGTKLNEMPFEIVKDTDLVLNKKVMEALGLELNEDLLNRAEIVE